MPRPRRFSSTGGVFHVLNRGVNHGRIFFADADRIEFGRLLATVHERFGVTTLAYCLMSNHYHLVLRTPDGHLSEAMQHLGGVFTRRTNGRIGRDGPLFRGRFVSIPVTTDGYLRWLVRYVHLNPLAVAGVTNPGQYRWSSMRTCLGLRPAPAFVDLDVVLGYWPDAAAFRDFHDDPAGDTIAISTVDDLDTLIAFAIADDDVATAEPVGEPPQSLSTAARVIVGATAPTSSIGALVSASFPSSGAHRTALSRARSRMRRDERLGRIVDRVIRSIAA